MEKDSCLRKILIIMDKHLFADDVVQLDGVVGDAVVPDEVILMERKKAQGLSIAV